MAAKLEILVSNRAGKKSEKVQLAETSLIDQKEENMLEMETNERFGPYKEFFSNLEAALSTYDHEKSFQLLNQARDIAKELIGNEIDSHGIKMTFV